jgi:hypothetical protein
VSIYIENLFIENKVEILQILMICTAIIFETKKVTDINNINDNLSEINYSFVYSGMLKFKNIIDLNAARCLKLKNNIKFFFFFIQSYIIGNDNNVKFFFYIIMFINNKYY